MTMRMRSYKCYVRIRIRISKTTLCKESVTSMTRHFKINTMEKNESNFWSGEKLETSTNE